MDALVSRYLFLSSSSASSVSWQFWMRNRFCSSSWLKMSSSCCGRSKNIGNSSSSSFSSGGSSSAATRIIEALIRACSFISATSSSVNRMSTTRSSTAASAASVFASFAAAMRAARSSLYARLRASRNATCSSKYSCGVRESRNSLYLRQSSSCSSYLLSSERMAWMLALRRLISCTLSCFSLASTSARFIASCTFSSFSLRKASNRSASSSSICSLLRSASSRCSARSSSLRISARLVSRDICTRKISRFLAMKSAMFSFSRRRWSTGMACEARSRPPGSAMPSPCRSWRSLTVLKLMRLQKVVFSATLSIFCRSRSSRDFLFCSSRILKTSSSGGISKGFMSISSSSSSSSYPSMYSWLYMSAMAPR
mmetsp:Transcript_28291/g.90115  ORF Transcript_28291/g.90115 Transcript_28291/m.90115 type:complete len:369 (+) Transcript_28291:567-1673(+)